MKKRKVQEIFPEKDFDLADTDKYPDESSRSVYYREVICYDENGEVLSDTLRRPRRQNGSGFVISYTEKICEFLSKVSTGSIVRVFMYIAHHQSYGQDNQFGFRCSHKHIQQALSIDRSTENDAMRFLVAKKMLNVSRINGCLEFMVNPAYVTIGADKSLREREWLRRNGYGEIARSSYRAFERPVVRRPVSSISLDDDDVCEMN